MTPFPVPGSIPNLRLHMIRYRAPFYNDTVLDRDKADLSDEYIICMQSE